MSVYPGQAKAFYPPAQGGYPPQQGYGYPPGPQQPVYVVQQEERRRGTNCCEICCGCLAGWCLCNMLCDMLSCLAGGLCCDD